MPHELFFNYSDHVSDVLQHLDSSFKIGVDFGTLWTYSIFDYDVFKDTIDVTVYTGLIKKDKTSFPIYLEIVLGDAPLQVITSVSDNSIMDVDAKVLTDFIWTVDAQPLITVQNNRVYDLCVDLDWMQHVLNFVCPFCDALSVHTFDGQGNIVYFWSIQSYPWSD